MLPQLLPYCPECKCIVPWVEVRHDGTDRHERQLGGFYRSDSGGPTWRICAEPVLHIRVLRYRPARHV